MAHLDKSRISWGQQHTVYNIVKVYNQGHYHECKYTGFTTRYKPLVTFKGRKARLKFALKNKKPDQFYNKTIWTKKPWTRTRMMGRESVEKERNSSWWWWWSVTNYRSNMVEAPCMAWCTRMNSEVLSAHIQPNPAKMITQCFTRWMDGRTQDATQFFSRERC